MNNSVNHKTILNKLKRTKIIHIIFFDHNGIKLESNNRKIFGKFPNVWKLNSILLNNNWRKEEIKN